MGIAAQMARLRDRLSATVETRSTEVIVSPEHNN